MEKEIEMLMEEKNLPINDREQVRFFMAYREFDKFEKGHVYTSQDLLDAFEAGVKHGRQYEMPVKSKVEIKKTRACNQHEDCDAIDREIRALGGDKVVHCSIDDCEDCFGC